MNRNLFLSLLLLASACSPTIVASEEATARPPRKPPQNNPSFVAKTGDKDACNALADAYCEHQGACIGPMKMIDTCKRAYKEGACLSDLKCASWQKFDIGSAQECTQKLKSLECSLEAPDVCKSACMPSLLSMDQPRPA